MLEGARPQGKDGRHWVKVCVLLLRAKEERPDLTGSAGGNLQILHSPHAYFCVFLLFSRLTCPLIFSSRTMRMQFLL